MNEDVSTPGHNSIVLFLVKIYTHQTGGDGNLFDRTVRTGSLKDPESISNLYAYK